MFRELPPKPDFDDALDVETAIEHIQTHGKIATELDTENPVAILRYELPLIVSSVDQYPNYRVCEEYGVEPPSRTRTVPESDVTLDLGGENGTGVRREVPATCRQATGMRDLQGGHADRRYHQAIERLYRNAAQLLLDALENGYVEEPITRTVDEVVPPAPSESPDSDATDPSSEVKTRKRTKTIGHRRLNAIGVELGYSTYRRTERQAVEAYYDRCDRIQDEEMIAEDFIPYIADPPGHVTRYPEESRIPTYGEPVDWDRMSGEIFIASARDLADEERAELRKAIKQKWPEEALV